MKKIGQYFIEHYQDNKYLGSINFQGILDASQIGYENRIIVTEGVFVFKRKHVATKTNPIMQVAYNMQGAIT